MNLKRIRFTSEAASQVSKLHPEIKKLIKTAITEIKKIPYSGYDLHEELSGFKSYKANRYRIVYKFNENENILEIYYVGHRRDIYDQFRNLLNQLK